MVDMVVVVDICPSVRHTNFKYSLEEWYHHTWRWLGGYNSWNGRCGRARSVGTEHGELRRHYDATENRKRSIQFLRKTKNRTQCSNIARETSSRENWTMGERATSANGDSTTTTVGQSFDGCHRPPPTVRFVESNNSMPSIWKWEKAHELSEP